MGSGLGSGAGSGTEPLTDAAVLTRPPPMAEVTWTALFRILFSTCDRLAPGKAARTSPAVPATIGAAADVPQNEPHFEPRCEVQVQPGAASFTHDPRVEKLYRPSVLVVAATLRTPGYAAG